jgi:hypothetical protein
VVTAVFQDALQLLVCYTQFEILAAVSIHIIVQWALKQIKNDLNVVLYKISIKNK